jgi:energy-coupling factor transporter ATP-binding protein EcfA2
MEEKLFLLGRPGSGKSTVRRYITKIAQHKFWSPYPIGDYEILQNMCAVDRKHTYIRPTEFGGFEVLDFSVLDTALNTIQRRVGKALERHELDLPRLAIIEFARSNYVQALSKFDPAFLKDAHFLILESDVDTCMERIYERTRYREFADDTYVPGNIMEGYYQVDATQETVRQLQEALGMSGHRIQLMRTDGSRDEFLYDCIRPYAYTLIEPASQSRRITRPLVPSHISYTRIYNNHCPSPLQDMQVEEVNQEEEANEQLDDTYERQLVGSASS